MTATRKSDGTEVLICDEAQLDLAVRRPRLIVQPPDGPPFEFGLTHVETSIGNGPNCDLVLADPSVSELHATVRIDPDGFAVRDERSTNGTRVAGARIERATLDAGAAFVVGRTTVRVAVDTPPSAPTPIPDERCGIVGESTKLLGALRVLYRLAPSDLPVLLLGETGTGKELAARYVHAFSPRSSGPFLPINCAAVSSELFESELFGHKRGAFTSATADRPGLLEIAAGGTIFFDEIGELPLSLQPKLLRVLEESRLRRVGGNREIPTDIRIVAATNRDLAGLVRSGAFRRDLFYRLAVVPVTVPSLIERGDDLTRLVRFFLDREATRRGMDRPFALTPDASARIARYGWPGNIRELRNVIAAACQIAADPPAIDVGDLYFAPLASPEESREARTLDQIEADAIRDAIRRTDGSTKKAAEILGLALSTMYDRMKRHGIASPHSQKDT